MNLFGHPVNHSFLSSVKEGFVLDHQASLPHLYIRSMVSKVARVLDSDCSSQQFRAARKAAEVVGAQIVLGDRPIEITVVVHPLPYVCVYFV